MSIRGGVIWMGLGLLAAALAPAVAGAARVQTFPASRQAGFTVRGSGGYRVSFSGGSGSAQLFVSKPPSISTGPAAVAPALVGTFYTTHFKFSDTRVDADFGRFGQVHARFEQRGPAAQAPKIDGCDGEGPVRRLGRLVGTIVFHGEGGYTEARASSVRAEFAETPALRCHGFGGGAAPGPVVGQGTILSVACSNPSFSASSEGPLRGIAATAAPESSFTASSSERVGPVRVIRLATVSAPSSAFLFDPGLSSATVSPPPPFSGSATFSRGPDGATSWSGDLAVAFPGVDVALVRPHAEVDLSHFPIRAARGAALITVSKSCSGRR